ncbi:hypothetical protein COOONC_07363, partial [Cooperia oncophora]
LARYFAVSPNGTEIEVRLVNFTKGLSVDGCSYAGVEIKTNEDQTLTESEKVDSNEEEEFDRNDCLAVFHRTRIKFTKPCHAEALKGAVNCRFCSPDAAGTILRSYINRVPIMTYNRIVKTTTLPLSCTEWFLQGYTIGGYQEESVSKIMWLL